MKEAIQQIGNDAIDVSSKGFTVYHRTGKGLAPSQIASKINTIIATGFKPGGGDMYGRGMYTTLNLKSQMHSYMEDSYGDGLVQYFVPAKGFIILDYSIAKSVYGSTNFSLIKQLVINGVYKTIAEIPSALQALSRDLAENARDPFVSADRAYKIWRKCFDASSPEDPSTAWEYLDPRVKNQETIELYQASIINKRKMSQIPAINGIVYTGQNDGNVVLVYRPSKMITRPRKWCVLIPGNRPSDVDAKTLKYAVDWQDVGTVPLVGITSFLGQLVDKGVITSTKTFEAIENEAGSSADEFLKRHVWAKQSGSKFYKLLLVLQKNGRSAIIAGVFRGGILTVDYFGTPDNTISIPKSYYQAEIRKPIFLSGIFKGSEFKDALFVGGRFESGVFNGSWLGGVWVYNTKAVWGKDAAIVDFSKASAEYGSKFFKMANYTSSILYEGHLYKLDRPVPDWVVAFKKGDLVNKSSSGGKETPEEVVKNFAKLLKIAPTPEIVFPNQKEIPGSSQEMMVLFKSKFPWLFNNTIKFKTSNPAVISYDAGKLSLNQGILVSGRVSFDYYGADTIIMGGILSGGNNMFAGFLDGGNYTEGLFGGTWSRGSIFLDKTDIEFIKFEVPKTSKIEKGKIESTNIVLKNVWYKLELPWVKAYKNDMKKLLDDFKKDPKIVKEKTRDFYDKLIKSDDADADDIPDYIDSE
jgi:hypothetical protein